MNTTALRRSGRRIGNRSMASASMAATRGRATYREYRSKVRITAIMIEQNTDWVIKRRFALKRDQLVQGNLWNHGQIAIFVRGSRCDVLPSVPESVLEGEWHYLTRGYAFPPVPQDTAEVVDVHQFFRKLSFYDFDTKGLHTPRSFFQIWASPHLGKATQQHTAGHDVADFKSGTTRLLFALLFALVMMFVTSGGVE